MFIIANKGEEKSIGTSVRAFASPLCLFENRPDDVHRVAQPCLFSFRLLMVLGDDNSSGNNDDDDDDDAITGSVTKQ